MEVLVNKANLVHNLFLVYLSITTCFGQLCAHHQEMENLVLVILCGLLSGMQGSFHHPYQSSTQNNKYQVSHKHSYFSWWWAHSRTKHIEIDKYTKSKYTKNKLCVSLALFTRLYRDARSTEHKIRKVLSAAVNITTWRGPITLILWIETSIYMHVTTYNVNTGTIMNINE
jgi:hypothetical protein